MAYERGERSASWLADWLLRGRGCHRVTDGVQQGGREARRSVYVCVYIYIGARVGGALITIERCTMVVSPPVFSPLFLLFLHTFCGFLTHIGTTRRISPAYTCIHKYTLYIKSYPLTLLYILIEMKIIQIKNKSTCKICTLFFLTREVGKPLWFVLFPPSLNRKRVRITAAVWMLYM